MNAYYLCSVYQFSRLSLAGLGLCFSKSLSILVSGGSNEATLSSVNLCVKINPPYPPPLTALPLKEMDSVMMKPTMNFVILMKVIAVTHIQTEVNVLSAGVKLNISRLNLTLIVIKSI